MNKMWWLSWLKDQESGEFYPGRVILVTILVPLIILSGLGSLLLGICLAIIFFFLGATCRLYMNQIRTSSSIRNSWLRHELPHPVINTNVNTTDSSSSPSSPSSPKTSRGKLDMRISGSAIIDEIIHEMIDYVIRDYVHSWYDYVSDDDEFLHELRKAIQEALVNLSSRVKEVDWTPYLTTQLVDDGASHLRLYRTALAKVKENPNCDLLSVFFDLEASMEKTLCRDMACIDDSHLNDYFQGIADSILYLLLPHDTYGCNAVGSLAQDLLVHYVLMPVLNLFSEPDFVNQYIVWLCQGFPASSDTFLSVIRTSDTIEEVSAVQDYFTELHSDLKVSLDRCSNHNGDEQSSIKSQLKCVNVIRKCVESRLSILKEGGGSSTDWTDDGEGWQNYFLTPGMKLHSLSLVQVLNNSVAVSYFLDYMNSVGGTNYLLMYFNLSAWKSLADQQFAVAEKEGHQKQADSNNEATMECLKTAATNVFDEFIPENAKHRVRLPETVMKRFYIQMQTSSISPGLFDDIYECLIETMESNEKYYPSFLKSKLYIKCLMDLDLLRTDSVTSASDDEDDDLNSFEDFEFNTDAEKKQTCLECLKVRKQHEDGLTSDDILLWERGYLERKYTLKAEIIEAGLTTEKGKQFGVYAIQVIRIENWDGRERRWHIYRRFSDFYDFHSWIKSKWMRLSKIDFPSKHTFRSTDRIFLEKRMASLNKYLETLMDMTAEQCYGSALRDALLHFLEPGIYVIKKKLLSDKIETLVNPFKQSVRSMTSAVKSAPDSFINTLDGFTKMFYPKASGPDLFAETIKVGASLDVEVDDNIPLRISLLLMDEVFDLKERNQWLRRRIVAFCREILKAMYGDTINRRIIDHVAFLTNPVKVSGYLRNLERTLWPDGQSHRTTGRTSRDSDIKMKTRIAAKTALFACISDDLKRLIGSETTRRGFLCVFDMLQNRILNRRFTLVLFEGILKTLFPDKPIMDIVQRLHFRSNRVGKNRPFLVGSRLKVTTTLPTNLAGLSPRGTRKKKT